MSLDKYYFNPSTYSGNCGAKVKKGNECNKASN
jgi:hypothetical protein